MLALRIEVLDDLISVGVMACCEDHYLEVGRQLSQYFFGSGTDVDWSSHGHAAGESHWNFQLMRF